MSKTFAMPAPSHLAALLLLCRASAWPADRIGSHGKSDNQSSLAHKDSYRYDNRSSKGMFSVREAMSLLSCLTDVYVVFCQRTLSLQFVFLSYRLRVF
jgi:hypothetical protein